MSTYMYVLHEAYDHRAKQVIYYYYYYNYYTINKRPQTRLKLKFISKKYENECPLEFLREIVENGWHRLLPNI